MSRIEETHGVLLQFSGQAWTAAQVSVRLGCAPSQARGALEVLQERGLAVCAPDGTWAAADVRGDILQLLRHGHEHQLEYTPLAVAEALPWLHLSETQALGHLSAQGAQERVEAWFSLPGGERRG